ncbi:MAG: hypothetical protein WDA16_01005 [Candidatus Thermoplasmatota archaeon]
MPRGVTDQFLKILENERKHSVRTTIVMTALFVIAYFMAELTDQPLFGRVVLLAIGTLLAGAALGGAWAWRTTTKYNASLRASWNAWMRMSLSATTVNEVARNVQNKGKAWPVASAGWALLLIANAALFVALWMEQPWGIALGAGVTTANGLTLGALAGSSLWNLRWAKQFGSALDELVTEGQVGLWGEL